MYAARRPSQISQGHLDHTSRYAYLGVDDVYSNVSKFKVMDSTLLEAAQFLDTAQKINIAKALDQLGVDYIELTSPATSEQSKRDCEAICRLKLRAKVLTYIRCHIDDAIIAVQTKVDGVNIVTSINADYTPSNHNTAIEVIRYLKSQNIEVGFSSEDVFRTDVVDLLASYQTFDKLGIDRVGVTDIAGYASPRRTYDLTKMLRKVVSCDIEAYFYNDTGCAIANAYCALEASATHVKTSVLGIGGRSGITPLGGLMTRMAATDRQYVISKYKVEKLKDVENLVSDAMKVNINAEP